MQNNPDRRHFAGEQQRREALIISCFGGRKPRGAAGCGVRAGSAGALDHTSAALTGNQPGSLQCSCPAHGDHVARPSLPLNLGMGKCLAQGNHPAGRGFI